MAGDISSKSPLGRLIERARIVLAFERLWPLAVAGAAVAGTFVAGAWLGAWGLLPGLLRLVVVIAAAAAVAALAVRAVRAARVPRHDALRRLDRDSDRPHRPISSVEDELADPTPDPFTRALWAAHRRRLDEAAAAIRLKAPSPRLVERDRYAARAAVLLAVVAAGFVAGADKAGRLAAAFDWRGAAAPGQAFRLDAWVDPPAYTGRAPVMLSASGGTTPGTSAPLDVPAGSIVVVRWSGDGDVEVASEGGLKPASPPPAGGRPSPPPKPQGAASETRLALVGDATLHVTRDGARAADFSLHAVPDRAPTIALVGQPQTNLRGSMTLNYRIDDDYGVIGAEAAFGKPVIDGRPVTGRSLVDPPKAVLSLPSGARGLGEGKTTVDLSDHPWAGAEVTAVLSARDEGGNTGTSAPITLTLPARPFHNPLARALVEERRDLVLDPDERDRVKQALDALLVAPDVFGTTPSVFLGLRAAETRLADAHTDADLLGVADLLWAMALTIEDGDLGQTERDLRALQRQLHDAIANHAPPEEIRKLTEALRQQLDKLLAEMAQKNAARNDEQPPNPNAKTVTPQDLQKLIDRMEQSARNGDLAEAQALLEQLQNILENLRTARQAPSDGQSGRMNRSMSRLDRMLRDQQGLRNETFERGNRNRLPPDDEDEADGDGGDQAAPPQADNDTDQGPGGDENKDLQGRQQALRQQLEELQKQMKDLGLEGEKGFDDAQTAMQDAGRALGRGARGDDQAVEAQGRALQGLQRGARGLQRQMAQGDDGEGQSGQQGIGRQDGVGDQRGADPLGRDRSGRLDAQHGLDMGEGLAERARRVLEELRRRLGDPLRPQEEQDYLERLLRRY